MDIQEFLNWAFQRHLNPISWYIRPLFLIGLCYFAYKRNWKGLLITFLVMTSSMVWFPPPATINEQMQQVLDFEKKMLGSLISAVLTLSFMFVSLYFIYILETVIKGGVDNPESFNLGQIDYLTAIYWQSRVGNPRGHSFWAYSCELDRFCDY